MTDQPPSPAQPARRTWRLRASWDSLRMQIKYAARSLVYGHLIRKIETGMAQLELSAVLEANERIALKPIRPYLVRDLSAARRVEAVLQHYGAVHARIAHDVVLRAHTSRVPLLTLTTEIGEVSIALANQAGFYREAELRLLLELDGQTQLEMGISIVSEQTLSLPGGALCLWIGIIKSSVSGEQGLENSRQLTKAFEGMRPKSLLLLAAQVLARQLGLSALYAVSNEGHIFSSYSSLKKRVKADYDQFWEDSEGERRGPHIFQIPLEKSLRDISTYKPNKRSQARRRQALEAELSAQLTQGVSRILLHNT